MSNKQNDIWNENMAEHKMGDHSDDFTDTRPCDCHKTEGEINKEKSIARQTLIERQIYQKGFGDGHKDAREYMKKLIKDEIWAYHELSPEFLKENKVGIEKAINELCMKSHNEVLEMLIKLL